MGGAVSVCIAEIVLETVSFGYRRVHAASVEKGIK